MKPISLNKMLRKPMPYLALVFLLMFTRSFYMNNKFLSPVTLSQVGTSTIEIKNTGNTEQAIVSRVVDGDTIEVTFDKDYITSKSNFKLVEKVRLIGINSPESVDPRRPVECMGKEASAYLKSILVNQSVLLSSDYSQTERDKYGRLLRYVYVPTLNLFINQMMIEKGYAYEYTYKDPYFFQTAFKRAEVGAQLQKIGLWNVSNCPVNNRV